MKEFGIKNIIITVFVLAGVAAFMVFSGVVKIGTPDQSVNGNITVWGTVPAEIMQPLIEQTRTQNLTVNYSQKQESGYENELINAFAAGDGPDLFIMRHENILRHSDKVLEIPYSSFPKSSYEATYIDESQLFLTQTGVTAFPLVVDPLVMYYNKALVSSAFLLDVPEYWDEVVAFTNAITVTSGLGEVSISGVALGTADNIRHVKSILSSLILQNGNRIVGTSEFNNKKQSTLAVDQGTVDSVAQAVDFYTAFAEVGSNIYSWNEALPDSQDTFIAGEVALYFGRASEVDNIRRKNPNLDFNASLFPQVRSSTDKLTQGSMFGVAIAKQTNNVPASLSVASQLAGSEISGKLADALIMAPARKDLLRNKPDDAFKTLVYNSAIISDSWFDVDPDETDRLFNVLIRSINTGASSSSNAIGRINADLNVLLDRTINIVLDQDQEFGITTP